MHEPRPRCFLLRSSAPPALAPGEVEHALRVLRLTAGDRLIGLDGRGQAWEFEVTRAGRGVLDLQATRTLPGEIRPGEEGARVPWIEVAAPLPKGARAEELVGRLTQLGVARFVPLVSERSSEQARELSANRRERLERLAGEALKQSGRLWALELAPPATLEEVCAEPGRERILLSPRSPERLCDWAARRAGLAAEGRIAVVAGPEGGFTDAERERLERAGARAVWLGPHVLRIETACEAAAAILVGALARPPAS